MPVAENILIQIFEKSAACMLIKADAPVFTIVMASDAYLALTGLSRDTLIGHGAFTVFTDNPDDPTGANTTKDAILNAIATKKKIDIPE